MEENTTPQLNNGVAGEKSDIFPPVKAIKAIITNNYIRKKFILTSSATVLKRFHPESNKFLCYGESRYRAEEIFILPGSKLLCCIGFSERNECEQPRYDNIISMALFPAGKSKLPNNNW